MSCCRSSAKRRHYAASRLRLSHEEARLRLPGQLAVFATCALAASLGVADVASGQSVLERPPNLSGGWLGGLARGYISNSKRRGEGAGGEHCELTRQTQTGLLMRETQPRGGVVPPLCRRPTAAHSRAPTPYLRSARCESAGRSFPPPHCAVARGCAAHVRSPPASTRRSSAPSRRPPAPRDDRSDPSRFPAALSHRASRSVHRAARPPGVRHRVWCATAS